MLNSSINKSELINIDSLKNGSVIEKQKILNFLLKNASLKIEIIGNNGSTREIIPFDTSNNSNEDQIASKLLTALIINTFLLIIKKFLLITIVVSSL